MELFFTFRTMSIVSVLMGFILILGASFTFQSRLSPPLQMTVGDRNDSSGKSVYNTSKNATEDAEEKAQSLYKLERLWNMANPIIMGSCVAVIIAACVQTYISVVVIVSIHRRVMKTLHKRLKTWLILHFLVFVTLIICLFIPVSMDRDGTAERSVEELFEKIRHRLNPIELSGLLGKHLHAYFIPLGLNLGFLFSTLITSLCFIQDLSFGADSAKP